jgi:hypothetical protein
MKDINHVLYEKETRLEQLDKHIKVLRAAAKIVSAASEPVDVGTEMGRRERDRSNWQNM